MRIFNWILAGFGGLIAAEQAEAKCTNWLNGVKPKSSYTLTVPAQVEMAPTPIGGVLASFGGDTTFTELKSKCEKGDVITNTLDTGGLEPAGVPNVYKTNIEGVGIRFGGSNLLPTKPAWYFPNKNTYTVTGYNTRVVRAIWIEYIRTGVKVGSGRVTTDYTIQRVDPTGLKPDLITYKPSSADTELVNNVYFAGCESLTPILNVPMSEESISRIKSNTTKENTFAFEVRCSGPSPSKPLPVKIYFEGDSPADGQLNLSSAGQKGVASGMNIALTNSEGVKLPFNSKDKAIALDWQRSESRGQIYRFSGVARYALSTGELNPGRANATMTYVLEYN